MSEEVVDAIDLAEIEKKYETKGYFARLGDMFRGLKMPHDSGETSWPASNCSVRPRRSARSSSLSFS